MDAQAEPDPLSRLAGRCASAWPHQERLRVSHGRSAKMWRRSTFSRHVGQVSFLPTMVHPRMQLSWNRCLHCSCTLQQTPACSMINVVSLMPAQIFRCDGLAKWCIWFCICSSWMPAIQKHWPDNVSSVLVQLRTSFATRSDEALLFASLQPWQIPAVQLVAKRHRLGTACFLGSLCRRLGLTCSCRKAPLACLCPLEPQHQSCALRCRSVLHRRCRTCARTQPCGAPFPLPLPAQPQPGS